MIRISVLAPSIFFLTVLVYGRAYDAGFVTDFTGLYAKMQGEGLSAALRSFGFPSLMPVLNVVYWLLYKFFGLNALGWFLCAVVCSTMTLVTFCKMVHLLAEDFGYAKEKVTNITLFASALVLFSPYQVEAMIWKVGLGHLMSVLFFLLALYQLLKYLRAETTLHLFVALSFLMLSLFCFEWGLVFPAMAAVLLMGYLRLGRITVPKAIGTFGYTLIPVVIYLILTKLVLGSWLGHYDTDTEMDLEVITMASTTLKYFLKHLGLVHFYPNALKESIYALTNKSWLVIVLGGALVLMIIYGFSKGPKGNLRAMGLSWALFGLVLVSGLYFHSLLLSENDRYGSLFIYFLALLVSLCLTALPRWLGYSLFLVLLCGQIFFQQKMVSQWSRSQDQIEKITNSFQRLAIQKNDKVLMLNLPENLRGTFMFRDFSGQNPIYDHFKMYDIPHPQLDLVAQYNVPYGGQVYTGRWIAKGRLRLEALEWGSWWWKKGLGIGHYETRDYLFEPKSKSMEVQLKEGHSYTKIIYFNGVSWQVL